MALLLTITLRVASSLRVSGGLAVRSGVRRRVGSGVCGVGLRSVEEARSAEAPARDLGAWEPHVAAISAEAGTPRALARLRAGVAALGLDAAPDEAFAACFPFELDAFQKAALRSLRGDRNVIVSAPTGSGKTVAGELAIAYALSRGQRVLYTTPLKALSNQKFLDFCGQFGSERVGLSTGDSGVRRDAAVVVMTTEVLRNMLLKADGGAGQGRDVGRLQSALSRSFATPSFRLSFRRAIHLPDACMFFPRTRARGPPTLKRRRITFVPPRRTAARRSSATSSPSSSTSSTT